MIRVDFVMDEAQRTAFIDRCDASRKQPTGKMPHIPWYVGEDLGCYPACVTGVDVYLNHEETVRISLSDVTVTGLQLVNRHYLRNKTLKHIRYKSSDNYDALNLVLSELTREHVNDEKSPFMMFRNVFDGDHVKYREMERAAAFRFVLPPKTDEWCFVSDCSSLPRLAPGDQLEWLDHSKPNEANTTEGFRRIEGIVLSVKRNADFEKSICVIESLIDNESSYLVEPIEMTGADLIYREAKRLEWSDESLRT